MRSCQCWGVGVVILCTGLSTVPLLLGAPLAEWRLDEGTGTTALDAGGKGSPGTIAGATYTYQTPTALGYALSFDGDNDAVDAVNAAALALDRVRISGGAVELVNTPFPGYGSPWWNSAWPKRQRLQVRTSSRTEALSGIFSVHIAWQTGMRVDFGDLRLVDAGGAQLPYWIKAADPGVAADVLFRVPELAAAHLGTVYLYYGNATAADTGSSAAVFGEFSNGSDGALTVSAAGTIINSYTALSGDEAAGDNQIAVLDGVAFQNGDLVLLLQMQNGTDGETGHYEFRRITGGGGTTALTLDRGLLHNYRSGVFNAPGARATQVVRVPQHTTLTVTGSGTITAPPWDGTSGGVVVLAAAGQVSVETGGRVDVSGRGFRGIAHEDIYRDQTGFQGESQSGSGVQTNSANQTGGGGGIGGPNGGGGGGGGNGTAGTKGEDYSSHYGGNGGLSLPESASHRLTFGGAGGEGGADEDGGHPGAGGNGGGIILIDAPALVVEGTLAADGSAGGNGGGGGCGMGGGGGGAGGSILANSVTSGTGAITATGGAGGTNNGCGGLGGGGGSGWFRVVDSTFTGQADPAATSLVRACALETQGSGDSWSAGKDITVANTGDSALSCYPVRLTLAYEQRMRPDFADLRAADLNGRELNLHVESIQPYTKATVWVEVPDIPAAGAARFVIYYGNAGAATAATDAFLTYVDRFPGVQIDAARWAEIDPNNSIAQSNALILNHVNYAWDKALFSAKTYARLPGRTLYATMTVPANVAGYEHVMIGWTADQTADPYYSRLVHGLYWNNFVFSTYEKGGHYGPNDIPYTTSVPYEMRIELTGSGARYFVRGGAYADWLLVRDLANFSDTPMRIGIHQYSHQATIGYLRVQDWPFADPEPQPSVGSETVYSEYPPTGSLTTSIYDGGNGWGQLSWAAVKPAGTGISVTVRDGSTGNSIPGFSGLTTSPVSLAAISTETHPRLKFQFILTGSGQATPQLQALTVTADGGASSHTESFDRSADSAVTLECWVKPVALGGEQVLVQRAETGQASAELRLSDDRVRFVLSPDGLYHPEFDLLSTGAVTAGTWQHVLGVAEAGGQMRLYINGQADAATAAAPASIRNDVREFHLGSHLGVTRFYEGLLDEVVIHDTALSSTEITARYARGANPPPTYFALQAPADGTVNQARPFTVDWEDATGAASYSLYLGTAVDPPLLADNVTASEYAVTTLPGARTYYWYAVAHNANGTNRSPRSGTRSFSTAADISGTVSYDGLQTGAITVAAGPALRKVVELDGNGEYLDLGTPAALQITGSQTIAMWLKPSVLNARRNPFAKAYGGEGTITLEPDGQINYYYGVGGGNGGSYQGFTMSTPIPANRWTHLAVVRDLTAMTLKWYRNGVLVNQVAASYPAATVSTLPAYIGHGYVSDFAGRISDVQVWSKALSAEQVQAVKDTPLTGTENGLAGWWPLSAALLDAGPSALPTTVAGTPVLVYDAPGTTAQVTLPAPGPYALLNLPAGVDYLVRATMDYNGNGSFETWEATGSCPQEPLALTSDIANADVPLVTPDLDGSRVTAQTPAGTRTTAVNQIDITFSEPVQDVSCTVADVAITGPAGAIVPTSIALVSGNTWRIAFPSQSLDGVYTLTVGPDILDLAGNQMNQNANGTNGDAEGDAFSGGFTLALGPRLTGGTPSGFQEQPVEQVTLAFGEPLDAATLTLADLRLKRGTELLPLTAVTPVDATHFLVTFPPVSNRGIYHLEVGPLVADAGGNLMDQNSDGNRGAADDIGWVEFSLASPTVTITTTTTIDAANLTYEDQDLLVSGTTLTVAGRHQFRSLQLIDGAVVTHPAATSSAVYSVDLVLPDGLFVATGCALDVSGRGYLPGRTAGNTTTGGSQYANGGSHGGLGGVGTMGGNVATAYDDLFDPALPGSGSGSYDGGAAGGGVIRIRTGLAQVDGSLRANGSNAPANFYGSGAGGGAGGSVALRASVITGSGSITANGGNAEYGPYYNRAGGNGGGGRIAVYYGDTSTFSFANVLATQGRNYSPGGAGTVFRKRDTDPCGVLVLDNAGTGTGQRTIITIDTTEALAAMYPDLLGHFTFDETAAPFADHSRHLASATAAGAVTAGVAGKRGSSVSLGGVDAAITAPHAETLAALPTFTFACWLNFAADPAGTTQTVVAKDGAWHCAYNLTGLRFSLTDTGGQAVGTASDAWAPAAGQWYHVACTYDGSTMRTFIDGSLLGEHPEATDHAAVGGGDAPLVFGATRAADGALTDFLAGSLDDAALLRSALAPADLEALYRAAAGVGRPWFLHNVSVGETIADFTGTDIRNTETTIDAAELRATALRGTTLTLRNGAILTHTATTSTATYSLEVNITGTVDIDSTSVIDVSEKGYLAGRTLGNTATGASQYACGGSYGGPGGTCTVGGTVAATYGDFLNPNDLGSGSGTYEDGAAGGGLVRLTAGILRLEGQIRANGGSGAYYYYGNSSGGGAGGGIYLALGTLTGSGTIAANGGNSTYANYYGRSGGNGGGGRIAVYYGDATGFDLTAIVARQGGSYQPAGAGTVFLKKTSDAMGVLRVANPGYGRGIITPLNLVAGDTLSHNLLVAEATAQIMNFTPRGAVLTVDNAELTATQIGGADVVLQNDAVLTHPLTTAATVYGLNLDISGALIIDGTSRIDASGRGYLPNRTTGNATTGASQNNNGGSHGGDAGPGNTGGTVAATYGNLFDPQEPGGGSGTYDNGSSGGGLLRLKAGSVQLAGSILANGASGVSDYYGNGAGGGAGGGIRLETGNISGIGLITANGGNAVHSPYYNRRGGNGGGGRIAVYYTDASGFDLSRITATKGVSNGEGGCGTVYLKSSADTLGTLVLNNRGRGPGRFTRLILPTPGVFSGNVTIQEANVYTEDVSFSADTVTLADGALWTDDIDADTLTLVDGALLSSLATTGSAEHRLTIVAGTVTVDTSSRIDVTGHGYEAGHTLGNTTSGASSANAGGSHAGRGGAGNGSSAATYGNAANPTTLGSGAGPWDSASPGGGVVYLTATRLVLDGLLLANGADGASSYYGNGAGGGGGGSVAVNVNVLQGSGAILATGGLAAYGPHYNRRGGNGGGGRIAIHYINSGLDLEHALSVSPGSASGSGGDAGTIHLENRPGPTLVTAFTPAGLRNTPLSEVEVQFGARIQESSFTSDDVSITGPAGLVPVTGILPLTTSRFRVTFASLTADGTYTVRIGPQVLSETGVPLDQDQDGTTGEAEDDVFSAQVTLDLTRPALPGITGFSTGDTVNRITVTNPNLQGTREAATTVLVDDTERVAHGSGAWSVPLSLPQGNTVLSITARDAAGNVSDPVTVRFFVDSVPPAVASVTPTDGAYTATAPATISLAFSELTSGLDLAGTALALTRAALTVPGAITLEGTTLLFTPDGDLLDGTYTVSAKLRDNSGLESATFTSTFNVDRVAPAAPGISSAPEVSHANHVTISGTKDAETAILMNGQLAVALSSATTWSYDAPLSVGINTLAFVARDRAGNISEPNAVQVTYDDVAPGTVPLTANGDDNGTRVFLNWQAYDEATNGEDIRFYTVYQNGTDFTDANAATAAGVTQAGQKTFTVTGLTRGQAYYFAVVATDRQGNANTTVSALQVTVHDVNPPPDVTGVQVQAFTDHLFLSWTGSANPDSDLAHYRVYANPANRDMQELEPGQTNIDLTGLQSAAAYTVRISAVDGTGNESGGVTITGYTLLANPANLQAIAADGKVDLSWSAVQPAANVSHYAVYVADATFTSVQGLTPARTTAGTAISVAGLTNDHPYFFAVTTVNKSGGETKAVTPVSATPVPDRIGPVIVSIRHGTTPLTDGMTLTRSGTLTVTASDPSGIGRVEFLMDAAAVETDTDGSDAYTWYWSLATATDGAHTLGLKVFDNFGNKTEVTYALVVQLAAPDTAPTISTPQHNLLTNIKNMTVSGTAPAETEVQLYLNGAGVGRGLVPVAADGTFSGTVTLVEGANTIEAAAVNRGGTGPKSPAVSVTLDSSIPQAPLNLATESRAAGVIRLSWRKPDLAPIKGYNLYRSAVSFETPAQATRVNDAGPLIGNTLDDVPPTDGVWYYRVAMVNNADTEGTLSELGTGTSDRVAPRATIVQYAPHGNVDPASGRVAPGLVDVTVTVSEALLATPFLSIVPAGGVAIAVTLTRQSDTVYTGSFTIAASTPSGTATALLSARDMAGNRGTDIDSGGTLKIDAAGPDVTGLGIQPGQPLHNNAASPVTLNVTLVLSEALKAGTTPALSYTLSKSQAQPVTITGLTQLTALSWTATFTLPGTAGEQTEFLSFRYQGSDLLDNASTRITPTNQFEIYQGDLPTLSGPAGVMADSQPGGAVLVTWTAVGGAKDYAVYRQAAGARAEEWVLAGRSNGALTFTDHPGADGLYRYGVAAVRQENSQESIGPLAVSADVVVDAVPPAAPTDLAVELLGNGVRLAWTAPVGMEPVTYSVYRTGGTDITAVNGLTPLQAGLLHSPALDPYPSLTDHAYTVTAVDAAGNESAPALSQYLNVQLLPVSSFSITSTGNTAPVLAWTHPSGGTIAGYNLYVEAGNGALVKLNTGLLTGNSYTDTGNAGDERRYRIVAVDNLAQESPARSLTLSPLAVQIGDGALLRRGLMNRLPFVITNRSGHEISAARLVARVRGVDHTSDTFTIAADSGGQAVGVVVGGYATLQSPETVSIRLEITPNPGETVALTSQGTVPVTEGRLPVDILNAELVRGVGGNVQFSIQNNSEVEIELITARNGNASDQVRFRLLDADGTVLSTQALQQASGGNVVTLGNGDTVARIPPGEGFTCAPASLFVPSNAPIEVTLQAEIDTVYFQHGRATEVALQGVTSRKSISLHDTSYIGEITAVTPATSDGSEPVRITGHARARAGNTPLPYVKLKLGITLNGFDRVFEVLTDGAGAFTQRFDPLPGESGVYSVWVVHPDRKDKAVQAGFTVHSVVFSPGTYQLRLPFNFQHRVELTTTTGSGTTAQNLGLAFEAADQPDGALPAGIHIEPGPPLATQAPGTRGTLFFNVWADNTAPASGSLFLKVKTDSVQRETTTWGLFRLNYEFFQPAQGTSGPAENFLPNLTVDPALVVTGAKIGELTNEQVKIASTGLAPLKGVQLSLTQTDGSPAPAWARLTTAANLGDIPVGEFRTAGISFQPPAGTAEGNHSFFLRIQPANYPLVDIGLYPTVTQSGEGAVLFKVSDIYTGTLDAQGQLIQGLAGAAIRLEHETTTTITRNATTDAAGEALLSALPAGRYKYKITADRHASAIGRLWIKPGVTVTEDAGLQNTLITVEWDVVPITIEDRYEIVLSATFETNVPAPVVTMEPPSVPLPHLEAGDVFNGEFVLTNHGLIRADNVQMNLPPPDENFTFELLVQPRNSLAAKEVLTVPYRITCTQPLVANTELQARGDTRGAPCKTYVRCCTTTYTYECANGRTYDSSVTACATRTEGDCRGGIGDGGPGGSGGGGWGGWGWGGGWGSGGSGSGSGTFTAPRWSPPDTSISGTRCWPKRQKTNCTEGEGANALSASVDMVGCSVNRLTREFNDGVTDADPIIDLTAAAFGEPVRIQRRYYEDNWHWNIMPAPLNFLPPASTVGMTAAFSSAGRGGRTDEEIGSIMKDGITYEYGGDSVFTSGSFRIRKVGDLWQWEDKLGNTEQYDAEGRFLAFGTAATVVAKLVYDGNSRVTGVTDKNDRQLFWLEYDADGRLSAVRDAASHRVEYTWSPTTPRLTKVKDVLGNETTYAYDAKGRIVSKTDPEGHRVTITYTADGDVASVLDADGTGTAYAFDYDTTKHIYYAWSRDRDGMVEETWFDADGELVARALNGRTVESLSKDQRTRIAYDDKRNETRRDYDEHDNLLRLVLPGGATTSFEYDPVLNEPVRVVDFRGFVKRYEYNAAHLLIRMVEAEGTGVERVTTFTYDANGQKLTETVADPLVPANAATRTFTYDADGNLASITSPAGENMQVLARHVTGAPTQIKDPLGLTWAYNYDAQGRLLAITAPTGWTQQYSYDRAGNLTATVDARGAATQYAYDTRNRLTGITDPLGKTFAIERSGSMPTRFTDETGRSASCDYDSEGRLQRVSEAEGLDIRYIYDVSSASTVSGSLPTRVEYPTFYRLYDYDVMQRVTRVQDRDKRNDALLRSVGFEYDAAGNTVLLRDSDNRVYSAEYDGLDRLQRVTDPQGNSTAFSYDQRGNLLSMTDANGNTTQWEYDLDNRVVRETSPEGRVAQYQYDIVDDAGTPRYRLRRLSAQGRSATSYLDAAGLPQRTVYEGTEGSGLPVMQAAFSYDAAANLTGVSGDGITLTLQHDLAGRVTQETAHYGTFALANHYTYYDNGALKTFRGPDSVTYTYTYDSAGRLATVDIPGQGTLTCNSYVWNRPAARTLPGGITQEFGYDAAMRLTSLTSRDPGGALLLSRQYSVSPANAIQQELREDGAHVYDYTALGMLAGVDHPTGLDEAYTWDAVGNRLTSHALPGTWTYDRDNRLLAGGAGAVTFAYDANGNVTEKTAGNVTLLFTYDVRGWLTEVRDNANLLVARYGYDPAGRRIWKEVGGVRTYYHYSAFGLTAECSSSGQVLRSYGYNPAQQQWGSDPLFLRDGSSYYWYHNDNLGTPQLLTSASGQTAWAADYDAFGNCQVRVSAVTNPLRFPGQYHDPETGLYYNLARYYDPQLGRYLQTDPVQDGLNYYLYACGNPRLFMDPFGLHALQNVDWAGFIPVYGSLRDSYRGFKEGGFWGYTKGFLNLGMAALECVGIGTALKRGWQAARALYSGARGLLSNLTRRQAAKATACKAAPIRWPPNRGFDHVERAMLQPGQRIDRYGGFNKKSGHFVDEGRFVAPEGVPFDQRALPFNAADKPYHAYEVVKPIPVDAGPAKAWFGQPGGGTQFYLPGSISELTAGGYIRLVR